MHFYLGLNFFLYEIYLSLFFDTSLAFLSRHSASILIFTQNLNVLSVPQSKLRNAAVCAHVLMWQTQV